MTKQKSQAVFPTIEPTLKEVENFIQKLTDATGPYPYINGTPLVRDAYQILTVLRKLMQNDNCDICGDHHKSDQVPYSCQTGDGV